jgi:hypothetical protein
MPRTIDLGQGLTLRRSMPAVGGTAVSTAPAPDTTPNAFDFVNVSNAALNTDFTYSFTLAGVDAPCTVTATGAAQVSINGGAYSQSPGAAVLGDTIAVKLHSSSSFGTPVSGTFTVGTVTDSITVTTLASDTTPNAFDFVDVTGAALDSDFTYSFTLAGVNAPCAVTATGAVQVNINGGAYSQAPGNAVVGNTIGVKIHSSASNSTPISGSFTVGTVTDSVTVTTVAAPVVLNTLKISANSFTTTTASGATIGNITGKTVGSTLTISPNDGRVTFNGAQDQLIVGLSASSPSLTFYTVTETAADLVTSKSTDFGLSCADGAVTYSLRETWANGVPDWWTPTNTGAKWMNAEATNEDQTALYGYPAVGRCQPWEWQLWLDPTFHGVNPYSVDNGDLIITCMDLTGKTGAKFNSPWNPTDGYTGNLAPMVAYNTPYQFGTGVVSSEHICTQVEGTWEANIAFPAIKDGAGNFLPGVKCAFWLYDQATAKEVDIVEWLSDHPYELLMNQLIGGSQVGSNVSGSTTGAVTMSGGYDPTAMNNYKLVKTSTQLIWYVNGAEKRRVTNALGSTPLYVYSDFSLKTHWDAGDGTKDRTQPPPEVIGKEMRIGDILIRPLMADTVPDAFAFTDVTSAVAGSTQTSTITVSGIDGPSAISISGGDYKINSGAYTTTSGTVVNGDAVTVRTTASAVGGAVVEATLAIGGVSDTFSVTTSSVGFRQPIGVRTGLNSREDALGSGSRSLMTSMQLHPVKAATDWQLTWLNGHINGGGDFVWTGVGDATVEASIWDRNAGIFERLTFGGANLGAVTDGLFISTDKHNFSAITPPTIATNPELLWKDQPLLVRYRWSWDGAIFPAHIPLAGTLNPTGASEGALVSPTAQGTTNMVMSGTLTTTDNVAGWQPMPVVTLTGTVSTPHVAVMHIGDSIGNDGANETAGKHVGWSAKGAVLARVPVVPWNSSGGSLNGLVAATANNRNRLIQKLDQAQLEGYTHVLDSLGTNDWPNNTTAAQMRTYCQTLQGLVEARGMKYARTTLPPRTNAGNTAPANTAAGTERQAFHAALRADHAAGTGPGAILFDLAQDLEAGHLAAPTGLWANDLYDILSAAFVITSGGSGYISSELLELPYDIIGQVVQTGGVVTALTSLRGFMFSPHDVPGPLTGLTPISSVGSGLNPGLGTGLVLNISLPTGNSSCNDTDGVHMLGNGHGMVARRFAAFLRTLTPPTGKNGSGLWTW